MPCDRHCNPRSLLALCAVLFWFSPPWCGHAAPRVQAGALIQTKGVPLNGGLLLGGGQVPLERAEGGDTPVLTFTSARGAVRMLLDTGAAMSMVSDAFVRRLELAKQVLPANSFSMAGGGLNCQTQALSSTRLPELRLTAGGRVFPARIQGVEALVIPGAALPLGVDGVVGASLLNQQPLVVDPVEGTVLIGSSVQRWRRAMGPAPQVIGLTWRHGVPLVPLHRRAKSGTRFGSVQALADTGAEGLFVTDALAEQLIPLRASAPARLVGVCGEQQVRRQHVFGIGLDPEASLNQGVEVIILGNPVFEQLGVEAIVGQELLRHRRQLWRLDVNPPRLELW
jgi:hypothetical protein